MEGWVVVLVALLRRPFRPETDRGRCAGLRNDVVFLSCMGFSSIL